MASHAKWWIGPSTGGTARGVEANSVEICAENTADADAFEWDGSQMLVADNLKIKCIDDINCSCQKLTIHGFRHQLSRNGDFVKINSTLNGRNCFKISKIKTSLNFT